MSGRGSRFFGVFLSLALASLALLFVFAIAEPYLHNENPRGIEPMAIFVMALGAAIFGALLLGPVGKAIGRMLESGSHEDPGALRLEELEARLASVEQRGLTSGEVDSQFARLADVEERLDFAERLLARVEPDSQERAR